MPPFQLGANTAANAACAALAQIALDARGVSTYVCSVGVENGMDWGTEIAENLEKALLMVVMGTETYGAKGTENMGTWEELSYAVRHKTPLYIIKMCDEYKESRTRVQLEPRQVNTVGVGRHALSCEPPPRSAAQLLHTTKRSSCAAAHLDSHQLPVSSPCTV
jgi:hypothetical protein